MAGRYLPMPALTRRGRLVRRRGSLPIVLPLLLSFLVLLLAACGSEPAPPERPVPADYTVVGKAPQKVGELTHTVTIILFGKERDVALRPECYRAARIGSVLPKRASIPFKGQTLYFDCR